jgi:hypothetical protein
MQPKATQVEVFALYASKHWVVVLNISNELAVFDILFRSAVVIRGISNPPLVAPSAFTSSIAEE